MNLFINLIFYIDLKNNGEPITEVNTFDDDQYNPLQNGDPHINQQNIYEGIAVSTSKVIYISDDKSNFHDIATK